MDYLNQPLATSMDNQKEEKQYNQEDNNNDAEKQTTYDYLNNSLESAKNSFNETVNDFSSKDLYTSGKEFIESNTIVTKIVFLILILIFFLIFLNLGVFLIMYFTTPNKNPYLINGLINGNTQKTIIQDPKNSNAITVYRSNNQNDGIEFTWSVWLIRNSDNSNYVYNNIFNKGSSKYNTEGIAELGNGPGVYFYNQNNDMNNIKIIMDTVAENSTSNISEEVVVNNLPFKRWFHLAIRMENKIMDIYVNGVVVKRVAFENVPFQNYRNVLVNHNGGFDGNLSDLRYYSSALSVFQIMNVVNAGPNLRSSDDDNNTDYNYLSNNWYMNN